MSAVAEVVALGARTPVGASSESSAAAVRAGISRCRESFLAGTTGEPVVVAADALLNPLLESRERMLALATSALAEVDAKLGTIWHSERRRCRVLLALPETRPGFSDADARWLMAALRAQFAAPETGMTLDVAGRGHAGSVSAAEQASAECARGSEDLFLVLGVESYHHMATYVWLGKDRRLAQPGVRGGFVPGEAAGCFALASSGLRKRLRLPRLAVVHGVATARETQLRASETGSFGVGMARAVTGALAGLALPEDGIDTLYIDINGERYRTEEWGFVALRTPDAWKSHVYQAPCDCWGDVGAAFATLATILAVQSFARHYARGPRALVMAGSDSGLRGALVLQHPSL